MEFSSLGGWVATRASGMKKNIYGNIEDLVGADVSPAAPGPPGPRPRRIGQASPEATLWARPGRGQSGARHSGAHGRESLSHSVTQ